MTDYTELKRLAEAANAAAVDVSIEITVASESGPNQAEIDAMTVFVGAAQPATVLALIAKNESLNAECKQLILLECYGGTAQTAINLLAERDQLKVEIEVLRSDIQSWRLSIRAERNVHKLSLKGVQDELDRLTGPSFTEELAALRKRADRYEWLREARSGYIEVVEWIGPHATGMTGVDLDALLDAAMGKGEQP